MRAAALSVALLAMSAAHASAQEAPDAYEAVSSARVHFEAVHLEAEGGGIVLSLSDGHGGWTPLGVAPSDLTLPLGPLELALSAHNHPPVRVPIALDARDGARLVARYESRQTLRELGVGIVLGTIVVVLIGIAIGAGGFLARAIDVGIGGLVAGAALGVVGGATGIALATLDDVATIDVL